MMRIHLFTLRVAAALIGALFAGISAGQSSADNQSLSFADFTGTWSGVFTTQENEFWGLEDYTCFPGCSLHAYERVIAALNDPSNDELPFGAFMGMSGQITNAQMDAILTERGAQIRAANTFENDPKLYCQPYGYVRQLTNPLPMIIEADGEHLLFRYEEWSLNRPVYTDGRSRPQHMTPSLLGFAVARIEGDALVIDTTGVLADRISDGTQAGYTGSLTGTERYTLHENPRRLELILTIEDPAVLTEPYVITKTWLATPDAELVQDSCSDYPGRF